MELQQAFQNLNWGEIVDYLFNAAGILLGAVVTFHVVPWLEQKTQNTWIERGVRAAEQMFTMSGSGAQKKSFVTAFLAEQGVLRMGKNGKIPEEINLAIEAMVQKMRTDEKGVLATGEQQIGYDVADI